MLCNVGVIITQLLSVEQSDSGLGFSSVGRPFATACHTAAIITVLLGAIRAWRYQTAMINGWAVAGGLEITLLAILFFLV